MVSDKISTGAADAPESSPPPRRGLGMLVVMIGVLVSAVDGTIVVLALPAIEADLGITLAAVTWVVVGYLLVVTVLSTQLGRLGDLFGRVRMYKAGFLVFTVGSVLCALAWNAPSIIGFRLLQGAGAALIAANSGAIISELYPPHERGRAYGFNAFGFSFGSVLGVLLGGVMVTYVSWQWIFWINVPIGIVALVLAQRVLRDRGERQARSFDVLGMITLGLGLFGVLWAMTGLASRPLDATLIGYLAGGVALLVVFVIVELRRADPTLDLTLFRIPTMTPSLLASLLQGVGSFAVLFLVIMYLQGTRGMDPIRASMLLLPGYLVGAVVGPYAGRLTDRLGPVIPATLGLGISVVAMAIFAQMTATSGLWLAAVGNLVIMIGGSFFFPANSTAVMKAAPPDRLGIASGVLRTFASIGMVFSFTTAILVASHSIPRNLAFAIFVGTSKLDGRLAVVFAEGLRAAFYAMMGIMVLAAIFSAVRGASRKSRL
ncbi:MFS transporter [Mangrovihabitans endophyticus]|uniref:MFS transporter n=1 Tax=Mangrovihabitans endophyticus TaxID=1751298 RepID=A0A8J3BSX0_9ACTN|nr:MFS transporter [Mangrovihabitans endophyticus]GGK74222.1 MFS transporter [Mangrovihabitans endophyticus]